MGKINKAGLTLGVALLALTAGCSKDKTPTGQVVATVGGEDITIHELNSELQLIRAPSTTPRKQVEQVALARVVERHMLAQVARKRGLDKNPQFLLAQRRVDDGLLVQALQADVARAVPATTREAAQKFMSENPNLFADRKIFTIDQIQFLRPDNIASIGLAPAKTIADVVKVLTDAKIEFRRAPTQLDALSTNPALTAEVIRITTKNPDEVFMFADQPQGAPGPIMFVNHVTGVRTEPFIGEKAIAFAQQLLQRVEVQKRLQADLAKFQAEAKPNIKYAAGYSAPPVPKPAVAAKPGTATPALPAPSTPAPAATPPA